MGPPDQTTLRDEIGGLRDLLDAVVQDQEGSAARELVQEVRELARHRRRGDRDAEERLLERIQGLSDSELEPLIAALSVFFDLANLAEDRQRVRVVREREWKDAHLQVESVEGLARALRDRGVEADRVQELLETSGIEFVFTAHPSEAKRRSVREKVRDLRRHLYDLDQPRLLPRERFRLEARLRADLTGLWQTEFVRFRRPSVLEELDRSLFFAGNLWQVVPRLFRDLREALEEAYPGHSFRIPPAVRFATWIGGDRDGNPLVTADVTRGALARLRQEALVRHITQARLARRNLSMSSRKAGASAELLGAIEEAAERWKGASDRLAGLSGTEPYRRWLRIVQWRLERAQQADLLEPLPDGAYAEPAELVHDLRLMHRSLCEHGGARLADVHLDDWICQAEVFGFGLMRLDVRQESSWYHRVLSELLARLEIHADYGSLDEKERQRVLAESMPCRKPVDPGGLSEEARETVELFRLLASTCRTTGAEALGAHVISMTHRPSDVLGVLWLLRWAGAREGLPDERVPIPLVPLFETIEDLRDADSTLDALLSHPAYREHVRALGDRQIVMVGYSDSTKDGGYLAASWSLYDAQARMQAPADRHGVDLVFFHGRGGALGRGGGPAARHVRSLPAATLRSGLRITEQGEVLAERYDDPRIARRHLQQMLSAVLDCAGRASASASCGEGRGSGNDHELVPPLAERSQEAYRALVEQPGFIEYFEQATPILGIEELPIGSRPARRRTERSLETLRAIPWVFSWTQSRHILPAWYGLGTALEAARAETGDLSSLRELYEESGFFRAIIDNAELALAKADMDIARVHSGLVEDPEVRRPIWEAIAAEYERTRAAVLELTGRDRLLGGIPWLQRSIEVRNPYVDPLNLVQVELFRRLRTRTSTEERERAVELIRLTIQGIAGGLRTTG